MTGYAAVLLDKAKETCSPANYSGLAARLGVSRQSVSSWRNGLTPLPEDRVRELARLAHVDAAEWWLAIQSDNAPEAMKPRVRAVLARLGIAAVLAIVASPAVARESLAGIGTTSCNTASTAYYVSRRVAGWLLRCVFRLTTRRKRAHAYLLALQG